MMRHLARLLAHLAMIVIGLPILLGIGPASQVPPIEWTGTYVAEGSSPAGTYTATTTIIAHGAVYEVRWTFPNGDFMVGVGFEDDGELVIGFDPPGVGVYRVVARAPLTLEARWTGWGFSTVHTERLVKGPPAIQAGR